MNVGFTGTRKGMTLAQRARVSELLERIMAGHPGQHMEFHHGMAKGADEEASRSARALGYYIVGHPGYKDFTIEANYFGVADRTEPPAPHLARNHHIVEACPIMIATPKQTTMQLRGSGTWATIRYSRQATRRLYTIFPDGSPG